MSILSVIGLVLIGYLLLMSAVLFVTMGADKKKAETGQWRIKEMTLFILAAAGGALGGFIGMFVFSHKSRKPIFHIVFGISLLAHIAIVMILVMFLFFL